jgi:hypothetical protein
MNKISVLIPSDLNMEIEQVDKKQVLDAIKEASASKIDREMKIDWKTLKVQANKFLTNILNLENQRSSITSNQLKSQLLANPSAATILNNQKMNKDRLILQSEYMLAFQFDEYLNIFRGEKEERKALYVHTDDNNKITGTYELSLRELVLNADATGRLKISKKNLTNENRQALEEIDGFFDSNHITEALMAYNGVTARLNRYYEKHNNKQKQGGLLMWKDSNRWKAGTVLNSGDLKEAYVSFLFDNHKNALCNLAGGEAPFYSHEFISGFFRNYINKVTSLASIVEEDVKTNDTQYAAKSIGAKLPNLGQFIDTAIWIVSQNKLISKEEIENYLDQEFRSKEAERNIEYDLKTVPEKDVIKILRSLQREFR